MLPFTKQDAILIAVTLAIILSAPLLVSAFYGSSTITLPRHAGHRLGQVSESRVPRSHRPGFPFSTFVALSGS